MGRAGSERPLRHEPMNGKVVQPNDDLLPHQKALADALEKHPFVKVVSQGLIVVPLQGDQQHSLHLEILWGVTPAGLNGIAREIPDTIPPDVQITYEVYDPLRHLNP